MSLLTIEIFRELNKSLSRKELIDSCYTNKQKKKIRQLNRIRVLFLAVSSFIIIAFISLLIIISPTYQLYKFLLVFLVFIGLFFMLLAIFIGNSFYKIQERFGMTVLKSTFCKEIRESHVNNVEEGLELVRMQRFNDFCKRESITITNEHLSLIEEKLMKDLKGVKSDNMLLTITWLKGSIALIVTSLFSVCLSRLKKVEDIIHIFMIAIIIIYTIGFVLLFVNIWRNDKENKRIGKYRDLLKTIENAQLQLIKD